MPDTTQTPNDTPFEFETSNKLDKTGDAFRGVITWFFDSVQVVVIALAIFVVVYLWILSPHQVRGSSMNPSFYDKELLLADKVSVNMDKLKRGDVIIFKYSEDEDHIKRLVGMPGDTVELRGGRLYINGSLYEEDYLPEGRLTASGNFLREGQPVVVPDGKYIVMGDNREAGNSYDSREYGYLDPNEKTIKGRVWIVYWPFENFRVVDRVDE